jgi:hypothetical protein
MFVSKRFGRGDKRMLPVVSRRVAELVFDRMGTGNVKDSWEVMLIENQELFVSITAAIKSIEGKPQRESFLRGAYCVWELLRTQEEIDEMNREWGI